MSVTTNQTWGGAEVVQFVNVDGSRVRVARPEYLGDGPPLLLISGMGVRLEMWKSFSSALPNRALLMFDFPGITGSPALHLPLDMPGLAQWLARLLDAVNVETADVLGYSWGGALAQQFARDAPQRVRRLVLVSTNFGYGVVPLPALLTVVNLVAGTGGDDPWKLLTAGLGGVPGTRNPLAAIASALNPYTTGIEGYHRQWLASGCWTSLPWLHEITTPTLVVAGDDDLYVPTSTTCRLARSIPVVRLELLPGGGHLLPTNQPVRLARHVNDFLGEDDSYGDVEHGTDARPLGNEL